MEKTVWDICGCVRCVDLRAKESVLEGNPMNALFRPMSLCPGCGNKRCPKATFHDHGCTGSNEPGQPGSMYQLPGVRRKP